MDTPRQESEERDDEDVGIQKLVAISGASLSELRGISQRYFAFAGEIIYYITVYTYSYTIVAGDVVEKGKKFLLKFLLDQSVKVPIMMVQLIVAGMPRCGKTTSMHELLKEGLTELPPGETIDNIGERDSRGFSFYELVALAKDENAPGIEWVASTKHTSYTYCILSGMLCSREKSSDMLIFKSPSDDSEKGLRGFQEDVLDKHFNEVYSRLHYLTKVLIPRSNIETQQLQLGISTVNIWDIGISASLLHMLPQLIGYLDHSFPMLALSLERDPDHMAERFTINDFENEQNLEVIKMHRLRENYIFRFSHMAKTNFQQQKIGKFAKLFFSPKMKSQRK